MLASVATWWLLLNYIQASVVWLLPTALLGTELILRGRYRWGMLLTSAALSLALFGHTQITFYILLTTGLYAVWMLTARWRREKLQSRALLARVGILAGSAFLALALAAIQLLPSLELTQLSHRAAVTDPTGIIPLPLSSLLTLILPGIAGFPPSGTSWGSTNPFDSTLYLGVLPLALRFLGNMDTTKPLSRVGCSAHYRWSSVGPGLAEARVSRHDLPTLPALSPAGPHLALGKVWIGSAGSLWGSGSPEPHKAPPKPLASTV